MASTSKIDDSILKKLKWVGIGLFVVFVLLGYWKLVLAGVHIYKTCWTCGIFANIYNAISYGAAEIVPTMQGSALAVMSVGLALWIVYKTYQVFVGEKAGELPKMEVDAGYFSEIYKRFLLAFAIGVLFLGAFGSVISPRFVLANTVELALDFGTSVGRHVLQRSMIEHEFARKIPDGSRPGEPNCRAQDRELRYGRPEGEQLLSDTTRDNLLCLTLEMDALRQEYQELGWIFVKNGGPQIRDAILWNIGLRVGIRVLTGVLSRAGSRLITKLRKQATRAATAATRLGPKLTKAKAATAAAQRAKDAAAAAARQAPSKVATKNLDRATRNLAKAQRAERGLEKTISEAPRRAAEANRQLKEIQDNRLPSSTRRAQSAGRLLDNAGIPGLAGNASTVIYIIASPALRMALAGIIIVGGFIFINLLFAFIIIEQFLFLGAVVILFPFLAAGYVFDETRSYATTALQNVLKFAIGLIVVCFVAAFCVELNLWIFGSMFGSGENAMTAGEALAMINADPKNGLDDFIDTVDSRWYFLWVLLAIMVNAKLLSEARTFAGWFGGDFQQSALGENLFNLGASAAGYILSAHKKGIAYIARGAKAKKEDGKPTFIERIRALRNRGAEA